MTLRLEIFPADLETVVAFYTDVLRFRLVQDDRDTEWPYVALRRGAVTIGAAQRGGPVDLELRRPPCGTEIVLEVGDVVAEHDRVRTAWPILEGLTLRPWGLSDFRILDPAGYYLRITST